MAFTLTIPNTKQEFKQIAVGLQTKAEPQLQKVKDKSKGFIGKLGARLVKFAE